MQLLLPQLGEKKKEKNISHRIVNGLETEEKKSVNIMHSVTADK